MTETEADPLAVTLASVKRDLQFGSIDPKGIMPKSWHMELHAVALAEIEKLEAAALSRAPEVQDAPVFPEIGTAREVDDHSGRRDRINALGGYQHVFDAIAAAVKPWPNKEAFAGISVSVFDFIAALSPPSTGGEGEAVAWAMLQRDGSVLSVQAKPYHEGFAQMMATDCGCTVQALAPVHPSPEMGEISRAIKAVILDLRIQKSKWARTGAYAPMNYAANRLDAILSKLKENGLSREELGGSARAGSGAAGPSDCAEGDARLSDGEGA